MTELLIFPDKWLSQELLTKSYNLDTGPLLDDESFDKFQSWRSNNSDQSLFVTARVPADNLTMLENLALLGFQVVEVSAIFEKSLRGESLKITAPKGIEIREHASSDETTLRIIAKRSFTKSRFHSDPKISNYVADNIKASWISNYFRGDRGDRLLVSHRSGNPVGFVLMIGRGTIGTIDLIAVDPNEQNIGIASLMLSYVERTGKYSQIRVGTQIRNIESLNCYIKNQYKLTKTEYVMHAHFPGKNP